MYSVIWKACDARFETREAEPCRSVRPDAGYRFAACVEPPRGPNWHAVAACLKAGDFVSIELGIARKYPPLAMIAL